MSKNIPDYFNTIPNSCLSEYGLNRLGPLRKALIGLSPDTSLTSIIDLMIENSDKGKGGQVREIFLDHELDYTLICGLISDSDAGPSLEALDDLMFYYVNDFEGDLLYSGGSFIYRSLSINNSDMRMSLAEACISRIMHSCNLNPEAFCSSDDIFKVTLNIANDYYFEDEDPFIEMLSKQSFLMNENEGRKRQHAYNFTLKQNQYKSQVLFRWVLPLCHQAYFSGVPASSIVRAVEPILEGIADCYEIQEDQRKVFKRRCLAHIAFGFEGLMEEIKMTKSDLFPLISLAGDGSYINNLELLDNLYVILNSPIDIHSDADVLATASMDFAIASRHGIDFDIDDLMLMEEGKKGWSVISSLGKKIALGEDILPEVISHSGWMTVPNIVLGVRGHCEGIDLDGQIAILKRLGVGLKTLPENDWSWTRSEKKEIISQLLDSGHLTDITLRVVKPDSDILQKHYKRLPDSVKRYAMESDFGL